MFSFISSVADFFSIMLAVVCSLLFPTKRRRRRVAAKMENRFVIKSIEDTKQANKCYAVQVFNTSHIVPEDKSIM